MWDGDAARAQQLPLYRHGEPALRPGPVPATERYEEVRPVPDRRARLPQRPLPGRAERQLPRVIGGYRSGALALARRRGGGGAGGDDDGRPDRQRGQDGPDQARRPVRPASADHAGRPESAIRTPPPPSDRHPDVAEAPCAPRADAPGGPAY